MNKVTATLYLTLGILAGIMEIEHGIGEVLEGYRPTDGVFILSWPDSQDRLASGFFCGAKAPSTPALAPVPH